MSAHENSEGMTSEWFTPPEIFAALGLTFDLDPCQPEEGRAFLSVPCRRFLTAADDGLKHPWQGLVWMNPPFGGRNGQVPWLQKFIAHGNGIALVAARTSAGWFHDLATQADTMLFPKGKTKFVRPDGTRGESPGTGIVLLGMGSTANAALRASGLGLCVDARPLPQPKGPRITASDGNATAVITWINPPTADEVQRMVVFLAAEWRRKVGIKT